MTSNKWHDSVPPSQPTRHRMRGRTDFQDSVNQVRREELAQEKRREEAMAQALRARGVTHDPHGSLFHEAQKKAIAARRVDNAWLGGVGVARIGADGAYAPGAEPGGWGRGRFIAVLVGVICVGVAGVVAFSDFLI